jgi:hypothetical protein
MFQFHGECRRKFGLDLGEQIWEEINRCFDAMPICKKKEVFSFNKIFNFSIQVLLLIIVFYVFMVVYHH